MNFLEREPVAIDIAGVRISLLRIFSFLLCVSPIAEASAADAATEVQWFAKLTMANYGKTYCPLQNTTFNDLAAALTKYTSAHPELHGQVTDKIAIQALAENYPCPGTTKLDPSNGKPPVERTKNIEVVPKGEFSTIDTKSTAALMQKLHNTVAHESDDLVTQIKQNSGNYLPPALFSLSDLLYRQGDIDGAIFWFHAARLRGNFDAALCTDISARSAIPVLVQQMPANLRARQFDDLPKIMEIVGQVLKWDESTPYNYDHRWISLHGMQAINSGLGNSAVTASIIAPRESWDNLAVQNRDQYRASLDEAVKTIQRQRENVGKPQTSTSSSNQQ